MRGDDRLDLGVAGEMARDESNWGLFRSRGQLLYLRQIHGSDELCGRRRSGHLVESQCDLSFP